VRLRSIPYTAIVIVGFLAVAGAGLCALTVLPLSLSLVGKWIGASAPGEITKKVAYGRRRIDHAVRFRIDVADASYTAEQHVDPVTFSTLQEGQAVQARFLPICPSYSASIVDPPLETPTNVWSASVITLVLNGVLMLVVSIFYWSAVNRRRLAMHGIATAGRVVHRDIVKRNKVTAYRLTYRYHTPSGERQATMDVAVKAYNTVSLNQDVTVLYDATAPENSMIYECAEFQIVTP
jgi:hypothetical protein